MTDNASILDRIVSDKKREIQNLGRKYSARDLSHSEPRPAASSFRQFLMNGSPNYPVIAEIKRKSPSKGILRQDFDPCAIARIYEASGAAAISVLTDSKYFGGSADDLRNVKKAVKLPVLRKDFVIDECQIYEARCIGADIVLLIAAVLSSNQLNSFTALARSLEMDVLIEVHSADELLKLPESSDYILGINNRNLEDFSVNLQITRKIINAAGTRNPVISESGIYTAEDIVLLKTWGARGALIGESLMKSDDPGSLLNSFVNAAEVEAM